MATPLVSICIPTYRYGRFIGQAIESILSQNFREFEILIVDDASPDDTRQVVECYAAADSRIIFEVNAANRGMVANWNYTLSRARGRYIKFLFADDFLCTSSALGDMVRAMEENSDVSLLFSARRFVDENGRDIRLVSPFGLNTKKIPGKSLIRYCLARMNNPIGEPSTVIFRRDQGTRGFDPRYQQLVDLEMWIHLLEQGDALYLPIPLSAFRVHGAQQTNVNVRFLQDDRLMLIRQYLGNSLIAHYLEYCQYYVWWKLLGKSAGEEKQRLAKLVSERYPLWLFRMLIPLYKLVNPLYKLVVTPLIFRV